VSIGARWSHCFEGAFINA